MTGAIRGHYQLFKKPYFLKILPIEPTQHRSKVALVIRSTRDSFEGEFS